MSSDTDRAGVGGFLLAVSIVCATVLVSMIARCSATEDIVDHCNKYGKFEYDPDGPGRSYFYQCSRQFQQDKVTGEQK